MQWQLNSYRIKEGALEDFEHAVRAGTTLVIAYIYLIEASLAHGDYRGCLDLCAHVLRLTQRPELVAVALPPVGVDREPMILRRDRDLLSDHRRIQDGRRLDVGPR